MRWTSWARVALVLIAFAAGYIIRFKFDYSWWIAVGVAVAIVAILMPLVGALSDFDEDF